MQQRNRQDECAKEPVGDIDVTHLALGQSAKENDGIRHPDDGDQEIDWPFEFCVFLTLGITQRQRNCGCNDDGLPANKGKQSKWWGEKPGMTGSLGAVIAACK